MTAMLPQSRGSLGIGEHFVLYAVQTDDPGNLVVAVVVTFECVDDGFFQILHGIRLGEDAHAKGTGSETSIGVVFYNEDDFFRSFHTHSIRLTCGSLLLGWARCTDEG